MLRQITEFVLINKVEEGKLIKKRLELRPHPEGCCDTVASPQTWLRAAVFPVLLHEACVFSIFFLFASYTKLVLKFEVFALVC